ncbi:MAG TPA: Ig-like domain-containing protein [Gemmatimonadaceae bacterium]|nr:Ig-like domain-containing protein [Gemmatimonadaceae bacterium]
MTKSALITTLAAAVLAGAACNDSSSTAPEQAQPTAVTDVVPAGGAAGVSTTAPIRITFSHSMRAGMEAYVALYQGPIATANRVAGTPAWSPDRTMLTFTPAAPLVPHTTYSLHIGGGMMDANGRPIDYSQCQRLGGQQVMSGMMGGGMAGGMMGTGWQGANGGYGMVFTFTTA